jgi:hypothetical protein
VIDGGGRAVFSTRGEVRIMARRKWWPIVLGIVIFVVIVGAGAIGIGIYVVSRQVAMTVVETEDPEAAFAEARAKFAGQKPYIEFVDDGVETQAVVHRENERDGRPPLNSMHIMAWDEHERKLVRLTLPFWILRLGRTGDLRLSPSESGISRGVRLHVSAADLERNGPGLLLDTKMQRGERLLVWMD